MRVEWSGGHAVPDGGHPVLGLWTTSPGGQLVLRQWCYRASPVSQQASKSVFLSYTCCISTTSCERHNQRGKGTVLHFPYSLCVGPDLRSLMFPVCTGKALLTIGGGKWVENTHIKESSHGDPPRNHLPQCLAWLHLRLNAH